MTLMTLATDDAAKVQQIIEATVRQTWRAQGLQPHRVETCKLSQDPAFVPRLRAIVGLYLHPPDEALVLSVDEKSQIQALDRTQPALPPAPGPVCPPDPRLRPARHDHPLRRAQCPGGDGDRELHAAPSHTEFLAFLEPAGFGPS